MLAAQLNTMDDIKPRYVIFKSQKKFVIRNSTGN